MHPRLPVLLASVLWLAGCSNKEFLEPDPEFDIRAEVLAIVVPDTVEVDELFNAEVGFADICGGVFSRIDRFDGQDGISLTPFHVVPQRVCPGTYTLHTRTRQISFGVAGRFQVVASGRFGDLWRDVVVVSRARRTNEFRLSFRFQNPLGAARINQTTGFWFPDRVPNQLYTIQSDSMGMWETTFTDTLSRVRYGINGMIFEALPGVRENGALLF